MSSALGSSACHGWGVIGRHILSVLLLPSMATLVVPALIVSPGAVGARLTAAGAAWLAAGALSVAVGLALAIVTIRQFAREGRGTLAPWDPTHRLVVTGVYRHVRNPMISGVLLILIGEALGLRSRGLALWAATFFTINAIYIPLVEERGLVRRFGDDYLVYRRHVPRWVPRLRPWRGAPPPAGPRG